jgi:hypothetical protein
MCSFSKLLRFIGSSDLDKSNKKEVKTHLKTPYITRRKALW